VVLRGLKGLSGLRSRRRFSCTGETAPGGFTLLELLVVITIITILMGMLLVFVRRTKASADSIHCLANLRQITTALRMYAADHGNRFPDPGVAELPWEATIQAYLNDTKVFLCNSDNEIGPANGSSYDWRDTGVPETTLAGHLLTEARRSDLVLTMETLPGWHAKNMMNAGRIDGSCASMNSQDVIKDLLTPIRR
jgi:prepilin-type N-terminal cleavage/methylation domain-containing protein